MKKEIILDQLKDKKIIIVGFGREGVSSYKFIRKHFPTMPLTIADKSPLIHVEDFQEDKYLTIVAGPEYDQNLNNYDLILKSPGVNINTINYFIPQEKFDSQTNLFLQAYGDKTIGVTGTKGKSTTASLIYHILSNTMGNSILAGNIGIPFFDMIDQINDDTTIVAELSAHQLEFAHNAPHIGILLNIYQEHLDHFNSFNKYQIAKMNITINQTENDILIYNYDDRYISKLLDITKFTRRFVPFSTQFTLKDGAFCLKDEINLVKNGEIYNRIDVCDRHNIPGIHNYNNIMAAILACKAQNISNEEIANNIASFKGLPHRIEWVGKINEINFYNDSISTIPEAAVAALKTVKNVGTLIIGGFDRGIDYQLLIDFLHEKPVQNVVFIGNVGERILSEWQKAGFPLPEKYIVENDYAKIVDFAFENTPAGKSCLLSPAAASYDQFKDFIERGNTYKSLILQHTK